MLDPKFIRENAELVKAGATKKHIECDVDAFLAFDAERRRLTPRIDELRAAQKAAGKAIASAAPEERAALVAEQKAHKEALKALEQELATAEEGMDRELLRIPNVPAAEVPDGKSDEENVEVRRVGELPEFGHDVRDHIDIATAQGWLDVEAGAKLAGSRNYVLKGDLALLEEAVLQFALRHMVQKGFTQLSVPMLVREEVMVGTGYFPGGEEQTYRTDERDNLYLAGTSEVPVTGLHSGEILREADLPKLYVARTTCYRREAGTYGKDTRGIYRVHQFQKVEQVVLDIADEQRSLEHHRAILQNSEEVCQALELPYRVVNVCGGDLGGPHVQKFDIETWMPGRNGFGETHSASRFHDYQARRLGLRYRDGDGKVRFCHTLNNTVAASTRMLIALLENHQLEDGRVAVPEALRGFLDGRAVLGESLR
ncbi:MAG TPA: serine--tRNA ligase [Planctomycetes bacterium]|nr:serine--tRNA ligase [Planctomycetota bacterium]